MEFSFQAPLVCKTNRRIGYNKKRFNRLLASKDKYTWTPSWKIHHKEVKSRWSCLLYTSRCV